MFFDVTEDEIKSTELHGFSIDRQKAFACFALGGIQCYKYQTDGKFAGKYISYGSTDRHEDAFKWIDGKDVELYC